MTGEIPAGAELVRAFANTLDVDDGGDELATPAGVRDWFVAHDLLDPGAAVPEADAALARAARDQLRDVLSGRHAGGGDPWAEVPLRLGLAGSGPAVTPGAGGVRGALGGVAAAILAAHADGSWDRIKICAEHSCAWVFYDRSKNRSGRWCSMQSCGNRAKIRAYRSRRATS